MHKRTLISICVLLLLTFNRISNAQQAAWESIEQHWNGDKSKWENYERIWYFFSNQGDTTKVIRSYWTNLNDWNTFEWYQSNKTLAEYDELRRRTREVEYVYIGYWKESGKTEYKYSPGTEERITSDIDIRETEYKFRSRTLIHFNSNNQKIESINFSWDTNTWKNDYKSEYSYDSMGRLTEKLEYYYDTSSSSWVKSFRILETYEPQHEQLWQTFQNNQWVNSDKSILTYSQGNLIERNYFRWRNTEWEKSAQALYTYNTFNQVIEATFSINTPDGWTTIAKRYCKAVLVTGINNKMNEPAEEVSDENIYSYPNPFNSQTTIQFKSNKAVNHASIKIFNLLGYQIKVLADGANFEKGIHSIHWDGTDDDNLPLSSGMYIVVLRSDDFIKSFKIALLR